MEEQVFSTWDMLDQLIKKRAGQGATTKVVGKGPQNFEEAILKNSPDAEGNVNTRRAQDYLYNMVTKDLKSPDLNSLRLVSLADKMGELRNGQTVFLNILETNPMIRVTDFQLRINERKIGEQVAQVFNPNVDAFAGEAQSNYPARTNTLTWIGNRLSIRIVGRELAQQSPVAPIDPVQLEIEMEVTRIRRGMNQLLLANQEVVSEGGSVPPQLGGFINRSTLYNTAPYAGSTGDLTNGLIQAAQDAIANAADPQGVGYNVPLVALSTAAQIGKVEDLMIARYPGENSAASLEYQSEMAAKFAETGIAPAQFRMYRPRPGMPILFIQDPQLTAAAPNTIVFFDPRQPQLAKFQVNGAFGPFAIERPTAALTQLIYCFDTFTLADYLTETRAVTTTIN